MIIIIIILKNNKVKLSVPLKCREVVVCGSLVMWRERLAMFG